jgi:hypothetical protein
MEFVRMREAWNLERKKVALAAADDQRALAMERAILDARRDAVAEVEVEISRIKVREEAQINAGKLKLFLQKYVERG